MSIDGKIVLITGAGRGIGLGLAKNLARRGARVALHCLHGTDEAMALAREIGGVAIPADLEVPSEARRMVEAAAAHFGGLDALVNNAGVDLGPVSFVEMTEADYTLIRSVNLDAAFAAAQAAAKVMIAGGRGGRIIQISSVHARVTLPGRAAYAATKGGLEALTRALALELAPHGITVNAIEPGFIEVERSRAAIPGYDPAVVGRAVPIGRVGTPDDIAGVVAFLMSDEASFMTGDVIGVDGGTGSLLNFPV